MLYVIEGLDASGKSTQAARLAAQLLKDGKKCHFVHFPRYHEQPFGNAVAMLLRGDFGNTGSISPYLISLLFACDQWQGQSLLNSNDIVILDRYYYSNIAYQAAQITNTEQRQAFICWLEQVLGNFKLMKPDLAIYLDVPSTFRQANLISRFVAS